MQPFYLKILYKIFFILIILSSTTTRAVDIVKAVIWNGTIFPRELTIPAGEEFKLRIRNLDPNLIKIESEALNLNISLNSHTDVIIGKLPLKNGIYPLTAIFKDHSYSSRLIARR